MKNTAMLSGALELISGPLKNILDQLGGAKNELWLEIYQLMSRMKPERILAALKADVATPKAKLFTVWKTLKLGTGLKTAYDFRVAIKAIGYKIGDWGNDILVKPAFKVADQVCEVDLVICSADDLGFDNGATRKQIYDRAIELGLQLCRCEVGPQLRLQYVDQPKGQPLLIAMEPISDSDGYLVGFRVEHDDDAQWLLGANLGHPDDHWDATTRWVFVQPRKVTES